MQLTEKDILLARAGLLTLNAEDLHKQAQLITDTETTVTLPPQAVEALAEVLEHLAAGREVSVIVQTAEVSTQQAADFLHVSRPHLVSLLEKGNIPFRLVGTHRRVLFADLQAYKNRIDDDRLKTLDELTAQVQELGMGY